ncbi:MAG: CHAP domain-containing protein [Deltaproteobacteria bacterium]|nr:CHAP domain-containing protein [Deltaproteobacteria bacterium]
MLLLTFLLACAPHYPGPTRWIGQVPPAPPPAVESTDEQPAPPAAPTPPPPPRAEPPEDARLGAAMGAAAEHYLAHAPKGFRTDCSGFVMACGARAGVPLSGSSADLWDRARAAHAIHHRKLPKVGDIAFFDNTYDRDKDGRWDDDLTHVAVVIAVSEAGDILLAHAGTSRGRSELRMNLKRPDEARDERGVVNDYLRSPGRDEDKERYLASHLWRGFATLHTDDLETWTTP